MGRHVYACPECGRELVTTAGWRARGRGMPCRPCVRRRTGWSCQECGSTDPDHPSPCPLATLEAL